MTGIVTMVSLLALLVPGEHHGEQDANRSTHATKITAYCIPDFSRNQGKAFQGLDPC